MPHDPESTVPAPMMRRTYFRGQVRGLFLAALGVALLASLLILLAWPDAKVGAAEVSLSQIYAAIDRDEVVRASVDDGARTIEIERSDGTKAKAAYPRNLGVTLTERLLADGVQVTAQPVPHRSPWGRLGAALLPLVLIGVLLFFYLRRLRTGGASFARSLGGEVVDTRFADIGGVDEVVAELAEVRDFLNHPEFFAASGARAPRGFLLTGPPGTGKTMLARAVAGESGVPFFALSGSDFVETFAGVGAARVRRVFALARKRGTAIIFIDEIDAVGKSRSAGPGGADSDERDRTLNQLLVEMDGFTRSNVIVIAATNRPDLLDPALLRPGRFDRTILVSRPDRRGRTRILELVGRRHSFAPEVDFVELARRTPGMTGADLGALINEAALEATRSGAATISAAHTEAALATTVLGRERPTAVISERDRRISAWHEAGHAVCALLVPGADTPVQVTIVLRGGSGGATWLAPGDDLLMSRTQALARLVVSMGGRAAEEIHLDGDFTSGPTDDYAAARVLATQMVTRFGMGPMGVAHVGFDPNDSLPTEVQASINDLLEDSLAAARALLHSSQGLLESITHELMQEETLAGWRLQELVSAHETASPDAELGEVPALSGPTGSGGWWAGYRVSVDEWRMIGLGNVGSHRSRLATATASNWELTSSLWSTARIWDRTVATETYDDEAIAEADRPSINIPRTSRSRRVNDSSGARRSARARRLSRRHRWRSSRRSTGSSSPAMARRRASSTAANALDLATNPTAPASILSADWS